MANRKARRATAATNRKAKSLGVVDRAALVPIREARDDANEAIAIAREKEAILERMLVQAFKATKRSSESCVLCLDCGEIRLKGAPHDCSGPV